MKIVFNERAWQEYIEWVSEDKKDLYSRRINKEHRLVYHIENNQLIITSCKYHYDK